MEYREQFIEQNRNYIKVTAAKTVHHFVSEHDDEWSVAMIAFNEAIERYTEERGSFAALAETVIKNRLTDQLRKEYRRQAEVLFEPSALEGSRKDTDPADPVSIEIQKKLEAEQRDAAYDPAAQAREEIEEVQSLLAHYGFSFYDLTSCSPKAAKTKEECAKAVIVLLENPELFRKMREKKALPLEAVIGEAGVKRKTLERHRKYIIAAAEILNGEYPLLAQYMDYIRKQIPI